MEFVSYETWRQERLEWLYAEIGRLQEASTNSGNVASVSAGGVSTSFFSPTEIVNLIREYKKEIAILEGRSSTTRTFSTAGTW